MIKFQHIRVAFSEFTSKKVVQVWDTSGKYWLSCHNKSEKDNEHDVKEYKKNPLSKEYKNPYLRNIINGKIKN